MTGVMPLPPANRTKSVSSDAGVNVPAGRRTSSVQPSRTVSQIQLDPWPPRVRLTVILGFSPRTGELASE